MPLEVTFNPELLKVERDVLAIKIEDGEVKSPNLRTES